MHVWILIASYGEYSSAFESIEGVYSQNNLKALKQDGFRFAKVNWPEDTFDLSNWHYITEAEGEDGRWNLDCDAVRGIAPNNDLHGSLHELTAELYEVKD